MPSTTGLCPARVPDIMDLDRAGTSLWYILSWKVKPHSNHRKTRAKSKLRATLCKTPSQVTLLSVKARKDKEKLSAASWGMERSHNSAAMQAAPCSERGRTSGRVVWGVKEVCAWLTVLSPCPCLSCTPCTVVMQDAITGEDGVGYAGTLCYLFYSSLCLILTQNENSLKWKRKYF